MIAALKNKKWWIGGLLILGLCLIGGLAQAQSLNLDLTGNGSGQGGSTSARAVQMLALLTVLSLAPSILIMMTSFSRIVIVLSFLRNALGAQQTPPNNILVSLALFLTLFIMQPTLQRAYDTGIAPLMKEQITEVEAFDKTTLPFKEFMVKHTRQQDVALFIGMAKMDMPDNAVSLPLHVIIPGFMISELRRAFEIGFLLFIPFLIIDMTVASVLMSMGMMMLPPILISLPFKIIFFVLVDGWYLIAGSLVRSYGGG